MILEHDFLQLVVGIMLKMLFRDVCLLRMPDSCQLNGG